MFSVKYVSWSSHQKRKSESTRFRDILKVKSRWKYTEAQRDRNAGSTNGCPGINQDEMGGIRICQKATVMPNKTDERIEQAIVNIRKSLMDGTADFARYSRVGAEAIRFQMEELEYDPSEIPSISTIERIIKRNKCGSARS